MSYIDDMGLKLANAALDEAALAGDEKLVDQIAALLGASSQSLEEAYLTGIRVRRSEARALEMIAESKARRTAAAQNASPAAG